METGAFSHNLSASLQTDLLLDSSLTALQILGSFFDEQKIPDRLVLSGPLSLANVTRHGYTTQLPSFICVTLLARATRRPSHCIFRH